MAQQFADAPLVHEQPFPMTYENYLALADEDTHAEWVNGEVIVFMPSKTIHQRIVIWVSTLLSLYARSRHLGEILIAPFEMRLWPERSSREPDILLVTSEHIDRLSPDRLEGPADLIIEVVSDSSVLRDRDEKFYEYQDAGVHEYWIIDPRTGKQRVDFYRLQADGKYQAVLPDADGRYHPALLPGFWFEPQWLWQEPLPDPMTLLARIAPAMLRDTLDAQSSEL